MGAYKLPMGHCCSLKKVTTNQEETTMININKQSKKVIKSMYLEFERHIDFFRPVSHDDQEHYFDLMCRKKGVFANAEIIKSYFMPYLRN